MQICAFRKKHEDKQFLGSIGGDRPFILSQAEQMSSLPLTPFSFHSCCMEAEKGQPTCSCYQHTEEQ